MISHMLVRISFIKFHIINLDVLENSLYASPDVARAFQMIIIIYMYSVSYINFNVCLFLDISFGST